MRAAKRPVNDSIKQLVKLCRSCIAPERLKGFMMAPWADDCTDASTDTNLEGIRLFQEALEASGFNSRQTYYAVKARLELSE